MDSLGSNPFAVLTFISAPAVLTNASCVLLFGTGNRYGRAVDRVHSLAAQVETLVDLGTREARLRIIQLESAERRTLLIVRALTCFYLAVSSFVGSTLVSLLGAIAAALGQSRWLETGFGVGIAAGSVGVLSIMTGALMLVRETRFSFRVLKEENAFMTSRLQERTVPRGGITLTDSITGSEKKP
jgi:hypothetical protein